MFDDDWHNPFAVQPSARGNLMRALNAASSNLWAGTPYYHSPSTCERGTQTFRCQTFGEICGIDIQSSDTSHQNSNWLSVLSRLSPSRLSPRRSQDNSPVLSATSSPQCSPTWRTDDLTTNTSGPESNYDEHDRLKPQQRRKTARFSFKKVAAALRQKCRRKTQATVYRTYSDIRRTLPLDILMRYGHNEAELGKIVSILYLRANGIDVEEEEEEYGLRR